MNKSAVFALLVLMVFVCAGVDSTKDVVWNVDNITSIGGHKTAVMGSPKVIETEKGKAVEFDGVKDGLIVESLPLEGAEKFTLEIIFRPDANGPESQRFLHIQENGSNNRILLLLETLPANRNTFYLDTFVKSEKGTQNLYRPTMTHTAGQWYNAALVYDGKELRHYINGTAETSGKLEFGPLGEGKTSLGVKLNGTSWFKGAISKVRLTRRAIEPKEFLEP